MANSLYYSNQIIFESQKDRLDLRKHNEFYDFMELDDRKILKQGGKIGDDALTKVDKYIMSKNSHMMKEFENNLIKMVKCKINPSKTKTRVAPFIKVEHDEPNIHLLKTMDGE